MKLSVAVILVLCMGTCCSQAFFPPKTKSTPKEVFEYRQRKKIEYERERSDYEKQMVASKIRVETALKDVPWQSEGSHVAATQVLSVDMSKNENLKNENRAFLFFMLFTSVVAGMAVLLIKRHVFWQLIGKE